MKLIVHNTNGSKITAITGFTVIYMDSYLSLDFFWRCLAMETRPGGTQALGPATATSIPKITIEGGTTY